MTGPGARSGAGEGSGAGLHWLGADLVPGRYFEGDDVARRIAPFVAVGVIPFALVPLVGGSYADPRVLIAGALVFPIVLAGLYAPWPRLPFWLQGALPLGYFVIVALLRDVSDQVPGPFDALLALPVVWYALYGTRAELVISVIVAGATVSLPVWLIGGTQYDAEQLAGAGVTMLIGLAVCGRIQNLIAEMRRVSGESEAILEGVHEAFISVDESGAVVEWNPQAERTFGWPRSEAVGRDVHTLIVPERSRGFTTRVLAEYLEHGKHTLIGKRTEGAAQCRDGSEIPVELTVSTQRIAGRSVFHLLVHDISERKRAEGALLEAEQRFRRAFDEAGVGMAMVAPDGVFLRANQALGEITGYSPEELVGMRFTEITHPDDVDQDVDALRDIVEGERYGYRTEKRYMHSSGAPVWIALNVSPIHDDQGNVVHLISQMEDISERKETEAKLTHQALHDPLTGLPNRILLADRVRVAAARRDTGTFAVIYLDLDTFKPDGDTLARLGGDEFAILCEGVDEPEARLIAERMIESLDQPFVIDDRELRQAASIGVAIHPGSGLAADPETILRDADRAMYRAKAAGKSRYALFDGWAGGRDADDAEELERDLRVAIGGGQLRVHYQPEIDLATGTVTGAEALVRWEHPVHGLLEPAQFISMAEANGMIAEVDDFVLWQACHQAARWRAELAAAEAFTVSVNVSEHRLSDPTLGSTIAQAVSDANLPPSSLCLEVAERAVMDRRSEALAAIPDLESLGVRLLIDDFGIALSSFSAISRLPRLSAIKIDSSFIAGLKRSTADSAGVAAIIGLAHGLKLTATAEGVETAEQAAELSALDCDRAQGFYFSHPQPPEAFSELLESARYGELLA